VYCLDLEGGETGNGERGTALETRVVGGRDGTGRDTGRDGTRDGTGRDGTGRDGTGDGTGDWESCRYFIQDRIGIIRLSQRTLFFFLF